MRVAEILVALMVVGGVCSAPASMAFTPDDVRDYIAVIPVEKVWEIVTNYLAYDADVKDMVRFMHTDEFKNVITEIDAIPEFIEFLNSLEESGYAAYKYWNIVHTVLGLPSVENPNQAASPPPQLSGGIGGLVSDVRAVINEEDLKMVYESKLKTNPQFKTLVQLFSGDKFQAALGKMAALPAVTNIIEKLGIGEIVDKE